MLLENPESRLSRKHVRKPVVVGIPPTVERGVLVPWEGEGAGWI